MTEQFFERPILNSPYANSAGVGSLMPTGNHLGDEVMTVFSVE